MLKFIFIFFIFLFSSLPWILFVRYVYLQTGDWKIPVLWWTAVVVAGVIEKAAQEPKYTWAMQRPFKERVTISPAVLSWITFGFTINHWLGTMFWGSLVGVLMIALSIYAYKEQS